MRTLNAVCVIAYSVASVGAETPAPLNLAPNPGFEETTAGRPTSWSCPSAVYSLTEENPRTGNRCLHYRNDDAGRYLLSSAPLQLEHGKRYRFSVWVRTEKVQGDDSGATICVEWSDAHGKYLGGAYPRGIKGTQREWRRVEGVTGPIPEQAASCHVVCYVRKGMTGEAWFDDVAVERYRPPLVQGMVTSAYRDLVSASPVTVKVGLNLADYDLTPADVQARLQVDGADFGPAEEVMDDVVTFRLDAGRLPTGEHRLVCRVSSRDGRWWGESSTRLIRVERLPERKAWVDDHQRLVLDGKPFFPLGTYWGGVSEEHLQRYADSPFNCIMPYARLSRDDLDLAHRYGVTVIYSLKDLYFGTRWCPPEIHGLDEERAAIEAKVNALKDHPAIIAWYINDELPLTMLDRLTAHRQWFEELDPSRPTWVVLYQVHDVRAYLPTFDIIGTDPYPIPSRSPSMALDWARRTHEAVFGQRAVWMVPQIFDHAAYKKTPAERAASRPPTLDEMRSMAWSCIAAGANGLVFYSWFDLWRMDKLTGEERQPFERRWRDVVTMAQEIKRFIPVILSVEPTVVPIEVEAPTSVAWRSWQYQGRRYLLVVNSEREPVSATFTWPTTPTAIRAEGGASAPRLDGDRLRVDLPSLGVSMLRMESAE